MEISYRMADINDLDEVFQLVEQAKQSLEQEGICQWDDIYPTKDNFRTDIMKQELHVGIADGKIAVVYTLNKVCHELYKTGKWQYTGEHFMALHRLCVSLEFRKQGIASRTLQHIEAEAAAQGIKAIRLDVFCKNPPALQLYTGHGYHGVGVVQARKGEFLMLEKLL